MAFQRARQVSRKKFRTRAEVSVINHRDKQQLVAQDRAHGVLVYLNDEPVGWCQFGPADELPIREPDSSSQAEAPVWRVTCFVVNKGHRRKGVAGIALRAALNAIRERGGGVVEAYPVATWSCGRGAAADVVYVQGVGPIGPAHGGFNNVSTSGTVSMFEKEGFEAVRVLDSASPRMRSLGAQGYRVVMRKTV